MHRLHHASTARRIAEAREKATAEIGELELRQLRNQAIAEEEDLRNQANAKEDAWRKQIELEQKQIQRRIENKIQYIEK